MCQPQSYADDELRHVASISMVARYALMTAGQLERQHTRRGYAGASAKEDTGAGFVHDLDPDHAFGVLELVLAAVGLY